MTKREIKGIGAIKGFAALVIAQFHMYFLNLPEGMTLPFSKKLQLGYAYGWFMVELFFLLSGFLMFYSHARRIACKERGGAEFLYDRFARLYPTYFTTLLYCAGLVVISRLFDLNVYFAASTITNFVLGLFMVHYIGFTPPEYSFDFPAWFLSALLLCYISFYLIAKKGTTKGRQILGICIMLMFGLMCFRIYQISPQIYFPITNLDVGRGMISFYVGGLLSYVYKSINGAKVRKRKLLIITLWITVVLVCYFAIRRFEDRSFEIILGDTRQFCSLFLFPLFVLAVLSTPLLVSLLECSVFRFLGAISYDIFLWHFPIIQTINIVKEITEWNIPYDSPLFFAAYYGIIISVAVLSYRLITVPGKNFLMAKKEKVLQFLNSAV